MLEFEKCIIDFILLEISVFTIEKVLVIAIKVQKKIH